MSDLVVGPGTATTASNPGAENITVTITPYGNNSTCDESVCVWWFKGHEITTSSTHVYEEEEPPGSGTMVPYTAVAEIDLAQSWTTSGKGSDNALCIPPYTDLIRVQDIPVSAQQWDTTVHSRYLKIPNFPTTDIRYARRVDQRADGNGVIESIITLNENNECEMILPIPGLAEAQSTSGSASIQYTTTNDQYKIAGSSLPYDEFPDDAEIVSAVEDDTVIVDGEVKKCNCEWFIFGRAKWPDPPAGHVNHPVGSIELIYKFPCCAFNLYDPAAAFVAAWAEEYETAQRQANQAANVIVVVRNAANENVFLNLLTGEEVDVGDPNNPTVDGKEVIVLEGNSIPGDDQDDIGSLVETNIPLSGIPNDPPVKYLMYSTPAACFKIKDGHEKLQKPRAKGGFECKVGNSKTGENLDSPVLQVNCSPIKKVVPLIDRTCFKVNNGYHTDCDKVVEGLCEQSTQIELNDEVTCFKIKDGYETTCATGEC